MLDQKNYYTFFFDQFPDGIIRLSHDGKILDINHEAELMLGWNKQDLYLKGVHEYLCPDDVEFVHECCTFSDELLKDSISQNTNKPSDKFEQWWVKKDGVFLHVEVRLFCVSPTSIPESRNESLNRSSSDVVLEEVEVFVLFSDCSQLQFSDIEQKRLSQFPELNPSPVLQLDANSVIYYANSSMTDLMVEYGFAKNGFPNILPDDLSTITTQCMEGETFLNIEKNYSLKCFSWNFHLVEEDDIALIQVYGVDITERKLYEKSLTEMVELLEVHSQQKSDFLANMSHELRTPLNGIIGMTNLIEETGLNDIQQDYATKIEKSSQSLLMLVNDILDLSKIEAGKLEINPSSFNLHNVMYETMNVVEFQAKQKNINLELRINPLIQTMLIGDALRIRQIILNFMTNAIKFTQENGYVFLNVSQEHQLKGNQIELHFAVDDNGVGIPEEKQEHVFGKYNQADKDTALNYGGTGLGLAICRDLAELMGGSVGLESVLDEGSSFWLKLHLEVDTKEELLDAYYCKDTNLFSKSSIFADKKCLIVGGFPMTSNIIDEQLMFLGAITTICEHSKEACEYLDHAEYDLVVVCDVEDEQTLVEYTNLSSQQESGKSQNLSTKFCSVLNMTTIEQTRILQQIGFHAYISKPIHPDKFKKLLQRCLNNEYKGIILTDISPKDVNNSAIEEPTSVIKVLLAEDNLINQKISVSLLKKLGCKIDIASDGQEAIDKYSSALGEKPYDIIFMDCHMPNVDGFDATRKIRQLESNNEKLTHIVALTANSAAEEEEHTKQAGMNDFLSKPINYDELADVIAKVLSE